MIGLLAGNVTKARTAIINMNPISRDAVRNMLSTVCEEKKSITFITAV